MIKLLKPLENYSPNIVGGGGATNLKNTKSKICVANFHCFFILSVYSLSLAKSHKVGFCNKAYFSLLIIFLFFTLISILLIVISSQKRLI